jgi:zinc transport system substrate-binding protein
MKIEDFAKKEGINIIFVQAQFSPKSAEALASEIDCIVMALDPLAENWSENMRKIAKTLKEGVK